MNRKTGGFCRSQSSPAQDAGFQNPPEKADGNVHFQVIGKLNIARPSNFASNIHFHPHFIQNIQIYRFLEFLVTPLIPEPRSIRKKVPVLVGPKHLDQHGGTHFETEPDVLERKKSLVNGQNIGHKKERNLGKGAMPPYSMTIPPQQLPYHKY